MTFKGRSAKSILLDIMYTVVGSALVALAVSVFTAPNDIAPGGVSGLATALAAITPIRISVWSLIINVPLLLLAWRNLGPRPLVFTLIATGLLSAFIALWDFLIPHYMHDVLLASFCGGVASGAGVGILFIRGLSSGGSDLAALLLKKLFPNIPSGTMLLFVDAAVVVFAVLVFGEIEVALYSTITIYISSKVVDAMMQGVDYAKVVYIVTDKAQEIADVLHVITERGTTIIPATGGYTGQKKQLLFTVTRRNMLAQTLRIIKQTDPDSFTFVVNSTEVHGEGFIEEAE